MQSHPGTHTHMHAHSHSHTHAHSHTQTVTHTHARTQSHTHAHTVWTCTKLSNYGISCEHVHITYLFYVSSDISRVEPNVGSAEGGTLITIHGRHFNDPRNDIQVKMGGQLEFHSSQSYPHSILHIVSSLLTFSSLFTS